MDCCLHLRLYATVCMAAKYHACPQPVCYLRAAACHPGVIMVLTGQPGSTAEWLGSQLLYCTGCEPVVVLQACRHCWLP